MSQSSSLHTLPLCTVHYAPARCRLYVTYIVCDSSLYSSLLLLTFPPPHRAHCEALELYCFLGKMPQASVQELRGVGACRLKYLQWRHAMASFIRCLTSWTIKLSSMLNHKVKSCFFMTMFYSLFSPLKGIMSLFEIARTHLLIWGSSWRLNGKTSHSFNAVWKPVRRVVKETCKRRLEVVHTSFH